MALSGLALLLPCVGVKNVFEMGPVPFKYFFGNLHFLGNPNGRTRSGRQVGANRNGPDGLRNNSAKGLSQNGYGRLEATLVVGNSETKKHELSNF